jgi:hypothetical protein
MDRCMKREHQRISRAAAATPHINQGGSRRRSV